MIPIATTPPATLIIPPFYDVDDVDYLYESVDDNYDRMPVSTFQTRNRILLPEAIQLAMELPAGAFIAGGFVKSIINQMPVKDYDIFFTSESALKNLVRRIHNAPA